MNRREDDVMKKIKRYIKIWWLMSRNSFISVLYTKLAFGIFLTGKILRFGFFVAFLYFLVAGTKTLAGYSVNQALFFFLTFNLIDVISQFLYREVYRFRPLVMDGGFDLVLLRPFSALFRVLAGGADVIDLFTIPPLVFFIIAIGRGLSPGILDVFLYILLFINGLLIATAFHIIVVSLGIITFEIDHTVMIYRDVVSLGRFPVDIYKEPMRGALTYLLPVGIMITMPAKALMGLVSPLGMILSMGIGIAILYFSLRLWRLALTRYTSASS